MSDAELFAMYQPAYGRHYDLANTFDRDCLYGRIKKAARRSEDYISTYGTSMPVADQQRHLRRHIRALARLNDIIGGTEP